MIVGKDYMAFAIYEANSNTNNTPKIAYLEVKVVNNPLADSIQVYVVDKDFGPDCLKAIYTYRSILEQAYWGPILTYQGDGTLVPIDVPFQMHADKFYPCVYSEENIDLFTESMFTRTSSFSFLKIVN